MSCCFKRDYVQLLPVITTKSLMAASSTINSTIEASLAALSLNEDGNLSEIKSDSRPYLDEELTINYLKRSKVMFIMRGLPGSGKSTLSKRIVKAFGEDKAVLCSGDFFFTDPKTGEYKFDKDKLQDAHLSSQKAAENACKNSQSPVIVDNTNVLFWEIKPYINIATNFNYIIILCEPHTPWKFDAKILTEKNSHGVSRETIERRLKDFKPIIPLYFAWFLNENDSKTLSELANDVYLECLKSCEGFNRDLSRSRRNDYPSIFSIKTKLLHVTAKYLGHEKKGKTNSNEHYLEKAILPTNIGKHFNIKIIGFTITDRTIGAQVLLSDNLMECGLWDNDLSNEELNDILKRESPNKKSIDKSKIFGYAGRAHITIGCSKGVQAVQTGIDQLTILINLYFKKNEHEKIERDRFEFMYLSNCLCYVKLKEPLNFDSVFTFGFY